MSLNFAEDSSSQITDIWPGLQNIFTPYNGVFG